jgi:hypothetical protein
MCDVERRERLETVGTGRTKSDTSGMWWSEVYKQFADVSKEFIASSLRVEQLLFLSRPEYCSVLSRSLQSLYCWRCFQFQCFQTYIYVKFSKSGLLLLSALTDRLPVVVFNHEDGNNTFFRNISKHLLIKRYNIQDGIICRKYRCEIIRLNTILKPVFIEIVCGNVGSILKGIEHSTFVE